MEHGDWGRTGHRLVLKIDPNFCCRVQSTVVQGEQREQIIVCGILFHALLWIDYCDGEFSSIIIKFVCSRGARKDVLSLTEIGLPG